MNITESLSARAHEIPDAPAVLTAEATLSYAELDRAVSWTAGSFKKAGLAPSDIVGIHLSNQAQHLITSLALARLGVGQIAFDGSDPPRLQRELARQLKIVATVADKSTKVKTGTPRVDPPSDRPGDFKRLNPVDLEPVSDGALPFLLLPTSGTTSGVPKVGLLTHAVAHPRLKHLVLDGPGSRFLSPININFTGAKLNAFRCLIFGGCLAFHEGQSPHTFVEFAAEHHINYFYATPVHAAALLSVAKENAILFSGVEAFQVGTALLPEILRKKIQERLTPNLYIHYGTTEVGIIAVASPNLVRSVPGVVGNVVPGMQVEVIDEEGNPMPPGNVGRLRMKSAGMISGYVDEPAETTQAFRDGWFYAGDLAEFTPDGELIHHGRADDLMILDGINIYPGEIENVLLRHPAVAEAAAFPIRSVARGDIPIAAVITKSQASEDELLSHCRSWLGLHAPHGLMIVPKLPRNAVGKILKNELVRLFRRQLGKRQSEHSPDRGNRTRDAG